ncbi:DUF6388 family protein [Pseudomonas weihenstephanensis]
MCLEQHRKIAAALGMDWDEYKQLNRTAGSGNSGD